MNLFATSTDTAFEINNRIFRLTIAELTDSLLKLSTAQRINRGRDDPAGLIASENLRAELSLLEAESRALQRTNSVATVADASLGEVSNLLGEANALAVANANTAGLSQEERDANQFQLNAILNSVNAITTGARFNGQSLFDGNLTLSVDGSQLTLPALTTASLGEGDIDGDAASLFDVSTGGAFDTAEDPAHAEAAQTIIGRAVLDVATLRGEIGAFQQNVEAQVRINQKDFIELSAARSAIADTDFAFETARFFRLELQSRVSLLTGGLINRLARGSFHLFL